MPLSGKGPSGRGGDPIGTPIGIHRKPSPPKTPPAQTPVTATTNSGTATTQLKRAVLYSVAPNMANPTTCSVLIEDRLPARSGYTLPANFGPVYTAGTTTTTNNGKTVAVNGPYICDTTTKIGGSWVLVDTKKKAVVQLLQGVSNTIPIAANIIVSTHVHTGGVDSNGNPMPDQVDLAASHTKNQLPHTQHSTAVQGAINATADSFGSYLEGLSVHRGILTPSNFGANLIYNPSFGGAVSGVASGWRKFNSGSGTFTYIAPNTGMAGSVRMQVTGAASGATAEYIQDIGSGQSGVAGTTGNPQTIAPNATYTFSVEVWTGFGVSTARAQIRMNTFNGSTLTNSYNSTTVPGATSGTQLLTVTGATGASDNWIQILIFAEVGTGTSADFVFFRPKLEAANAPTMFDDNVTGILHSTNFGSDGTLSKSSTFNKNVLNSLTNLSTDLFVNTGSTASTNITVWFTSKSGHSDNPNGGTLPAWTFPDGSGGIYPTAAACGSSASPWNTFGSLTASTAYVLILGYNVSTGLFTGQALKAGTAAVTQAAIDAVIKDGTVLVSCANISTGQATAGGSTGGFGGGGGGNGRFY